MNLTYLLGAGASANALPLINDIPQRMRIFLNHFQEVNAGISFAPDASFQECYKQLNHYITEIEKHYTIDTYARKLSLKRNTETELFKLLDFFGAYFIYEQLTKDFKSSLNDYLDRGLNPDRSSASFNSLSQKIIRPLDYRYDSFFASLLKKENNLLSLSSNINIISWNYDFQLEIAYMNFMESGSLNEAQKLLNVFPSPNNHTLNLNKSKIIKLNGTAGFHLGQTSSTFGDSFDFNKHLLDKTSFSLLFDILSQSRSFSKNSIKFAWSDDEDVKLSRNYAEDILCHTDILVVIGYSFPYFNREVDRSLFKKLITGRQKLPIIYLQTPSNTVDSVKNRMIGVNKFFENTIPFTELDQFLIPNEME